MTIEQLLQHPWIVTGGAPRGSAREAKLRDDAKRIEFRQLTSKLRAACFAILLQHQAEAREQADAQPQEAAPFGKAARLQKVKAALRRRDSFLKPMIEGDMLTKAFRVRRH